MNSPRRVGSAIWISDIEDAVAEEAIRLTTDTTFPPFLKPRPSKKMWIHLNKGNNLWIDGFLERHAIDPSRLRVYVSAYFDEKSGRLRVPPHVIELICRLGVKNVEFGFDCTSALPNEGE